MLDISATYLKNVIKMHKDKNSEEYEKAGREDMSHWVYDDEQKTMVTKHKEKIVKHNLKGALFSMMSGLKEKKAAATEGK